MRYQPILDPEQLPGVGPLPEHLRFDMKLQVPEHLLKAPKPSELATDLAAFANAVGGVLLVGAKEKPRGTLERYVPMDFTMAQEIVDSYRRAQALCSPRPVVDPRPMPLKRNSAEWVVTVNVDAYAAPPIGVCRENESGGHKWWAFPVRRGSETRNLRPEELATIMDPHLRRMILLLERLQYEPGRPPIALFHANGTSGQFEISQLDSDAGVMQLVEVESRESLVVPLDAVRSAWKGADGKNNVAIMGQLYCSTSTGTNNRLRQSNWGYVFSGR
jgi:Schlafen, AlbA_2